MFGNGTCGSIWSIESGHGSRVNSLQAEKYLTLGEEYLRDHFPTFPVMPGVLMLQCVVEASSWLWRISNDFQQSVSHCGKFVMLSTVLHGAGPSKEISVELVKQEGGYATFKGKGNVQGGAQTVSAQIVLAAYNVADRKRRG